MCDLTEVTHDRFDRLEGSQVVHNFIYTPITSNSKHWMLAVYTRTTLSREDFVEFLVLDLKISMALTEGRAKILHWTTVNLGDTTILSNITILIWNRFRYRIDLVLIKIDRPRYIALQIKYRKIAMYFLAETSCTLKVWSKTRRLGH